MATDEPANNGDQRDTLGRFTAGNSGRRKGSLNRSTELARLLLARNAGPIMRRLIEAATDRNDPSHAVALKLAVERLLPAARHQPDLKGVDLPGMTGARDLPLLTAAILGAVVDGRLSLPDVLPALEIVKTTAQAIAVGDHDVRLAQLERVIEARRLANGN